MKPIEKFANLAAGLLLATVAVAEPALKDVFKHDFLIGAALNPSQFCESNVVEAALIRRHFNTITAENVMKWEKIHPRPGQYDFALADRFVDFGRTNGMAVIGHTLVWHEQTPKWVFEDAQGQPVSREVLLERMRDHISRVVGRYRGRVQGWDVVNEAVAENGTLRQSPWLKIIGEDFLVKAYQFAHEADPQAELYYNDFSLEKPAKGAGAIALVKKLQAAGVNLAGVGLQGHCSLEHPDTGRLDATIAAFEKLGVKVMITELDINVLPSPKRQDGAEVSVRFEMNKGLNPYTNGLPDKVQQQLAQRYADLFSILLKHRDSISRVTFWGVTDGNSWLNDWPIDGRTAHPLLFDRAGQPKPAFDAVLRVAAGVSANLK